MSYIGGITEEKIEEVFNSVDTNNSGQIECKELDCAFKAAGMDEDAAKRCRDNCDADNDSKISMDEFKTLFKVKQ